MNSLHPVNLLKKAMSFVNFPAPSAEIAVGDCFTETNKPLSVWIVDRIFDVSISDFTLISLKHAGRPELTKTISLCVLEEGEEFLPTIIQ